MSYRVGKHTTSKMLREDACVYWGISEVEYILWTMNGAKARSPPCGRARALDERRHGSSRRCDASSGRGPQPQDAGAVIAVMARLSRACARHGGARFAHARRAWAPTWMSWGLEDAGAGVAVATAAPAQAEAALGGATKDCINGRGTSARGNGWRRDCLWR